MVWKTELVTNMEGETVLRRVGNYRLSWGSKDLMFEQLYSHQGKTGSVCVLEI